MLSMELDRLRQRSVAGLIHKDIVVIVVIVIAITIAEVFKLGRGIAKYMLHCYWA